MLKKMFLCTFFTTQILSATELPFSRGVNIAGWFQAPSVRQIQFTKINKQDFVILQTMGCDVVRLPLNLHFMTDGAPDYKIDPLFYSFLDQVVDWAEELQIHLILDNHTFDPAVDTDPHIGDVLVPVWQQMAEHYQNRSTFIYFEILNEPHGISDVLWNDIQKNVLAAIREIDTKHTVIIGPASWNSYQNLAAMPVYDDDNLIYTFHFYDPFIFTHQGASWVEPSMAPLSGVPYPYESGRMPALPTSLRNSWIANSYDAYPTEGNSVKIKELFDIAINFAAQRNVPIFCGEFGVLMDNSENGDRVRWHKVVTDYLTENKISWTLWEFNGSFGIYEKGSNHLWQSDLNVPLIEAMGLTPLSQSEFNITPDEDEFAIYRDYIAENISAAEFGNSGTLDYYSENEPQNGLYCISWTGAAQYQNIAFYFKPDKDLTVLHDAGFALNLWMRGDTPGKKIDLRFIDSKTTEAGDHPWRMNYTVSEPALPMDGQWHNLHILLSQFSDGGSWDDGWFEPSGKFDWTAVDRFELVAEHNDLGSAQFWFDDIRVVDPGAVAVAELENRPQNYQLSQNYPNPFNPSTRIGFYLPQSEFVTIAIFNSLGQRIRTLVNSVKNTGNHTVEWHGRTAYGLPAASGIYYYKMWTQDFSQVKSLSLVK
ncbi:MAG: T9SS C-terminal target domain-containing protein [Calditrichaeota bacterium]|nr:MAG: T9SS C-terminal target domain-containing protein [Calditrichota bacterium]